MIRKITVLTAVAVLICAVAGADVSKARAAMGQFDAEMKSAGEAAAKNDAKSAASHEANARKHLKEACAEFESAGAVESDDVELLRDYAEALMRNEDFDLAADALQRAVRIQADDAALWSTLGFVLSELGTKKVNEAAAAFRKALELNPQAEAAAAAWLGLGELYCRESLHDLAREAYAKALEAKPDFRKAILAAAAAGVRDGEVLEAANALDALGMMSSDEAEMLSAKLSESLQAFEEARLVFPDTHEHHMAYAKLLLRAGRNAQALAAAERAAALNGSDYVTWNMVGGLSRQTGDNNRAREAYSKSLEIKPDQPRTREALQALGFSN